MGIGEALVGLLCGSAVAVMTIGFIAVVAKQFLYICEPHEILVFSGGQRVENGVEKGYRVIYGGRAWAIPVIERAERMDCRNIAIDIHTTNAYSKGGIPLNVHAVANVKVSKNNDLVGNAIERFLGRDPSEIKRVAKETLEGHLRGVLATLTPEEVNEDRLKFANALKDEAHEDFDKLGLRLDTLKIQAVSDDVNYLNSIGRKQIAHVIRDAEVAEANNLSLAEQSEARARQAGEVANSMAQTKIVEAENQVMQIKAELLAEAQSERERTQAAAAQARAEAELELQDIRKKLEELRLNADVVLPAQAAQQAASFRATGDASYSEQEGRAAAYVLSLMTEAWKKAGSDAKDIFLIQNLETVLNTVVQRVNAIEIDEVNLLDNGDGTALPAHVASYPAMVASILKELEASTGVDVVGILGSASKPDPMIIEAKEVK
jgi:flotillin